MNFFQLKAHLGFRRKIINLKSFFYGIRHQLIIYNLQTALINLKTALKLAYKINKAGGHILVFNTDPNLQLLVHKALQLSNMSYFQDYYGGFLNKWDYSLFKRYQTVKSVLHFLGDKPNTYLSFSKVHNRFIGIKPHLMHQKPSLIIALQYHEPFLKEAKNNMIPTVSIVESINTNGLLPDFPIPANSQSFDFIYQFLKLFVSVTRSSTL